MPYALYIHIPFCVRKCYYCDFVSFPYEEKAADNYIESLGREMALQARKLSSNEVRTVFIGGGTPTVLNYRQLDRLTDLMHSNFTVPANTEFTVEANPGTLDSAKLKLLRAKGVNRLSIGAQSFDDQLLKKIGRVHNSTQIKEALSMAREAGFENISLDLIFGLPGQSLEEWQRDLAQAVSLEPGHISAYGLKIEEGTPFSRDKECGLLIPCDEDTEFAMYQWTIDFLAAAGYLQYEISNFARPGWESRHNLVYWHNEEYLGCGVAAHSFMEGCRWFNYSTVSAYQDALQQGRLPIEEKQKLPLKEQAEDAIFLGLRTRAGIDLNSYQKRYGIDITAEYKEAVARHLANALIELDEGFMRLTRAGLLLANEVMADFI